MANDAGMIAQASGMDSSMPPSIPTHPSSPYHPMIRDVVQQASDTDTLSDQLHILKKTLFAPNDLDAIQSVIDMIQQGAPLPHIQQVIPIQ